MVRIGLVFLLFLAQFGTVNAQEYLSPFELEQKILTVNFLAVSDTTDEVKINTCDSIQTWLSHNLQNPESWDYPFDSLHLTTIPVAKHPKSNVRIFSYNAVLKGGIFRHYAIIQHHHKKYIETFALLDTMQELHKDALMDGLNADEWIGALYYQIIPFKHRRKQVYILMGFDGYNTKGNRSILDVLYFEDKLPMFGYELFRSSEYDPTPEPREIFQYDESVVMSLRYEEQGNTIVMEDLVPKRPELEGDPWSLIPSGYYSAYVRDGKTWVKKSLTDKLPFAEPRQLENQINR
jgi:hypothetical protein